MTKKKEKVNKVVDIDKQNMSVKKETAAKVQSKIDIACDMLLRGTSMPEIELVIGKASYAAIRKMEKNGFTFDRTLKNEKGHTFYKAVAPNEDVVAA